MEKNEDDLNKKYLFFIPLKFRGKPFLGLVQLSKIFDNYYCHLYPNKRKEIIQRVTLFCSTD